MSQRFRHLAVRRAWIPLLSQWISVYFSCFTRFESASSLKDLSIWPNFLDNPVTTKTHCWLQVKFPKAWSAQSGHRTEICRSVVSKGSAKSRQSSSHYIILQLYTIIVSVSYCISWHWFYFFFATLLFESMQACRPGIDNS